MILTQLDIQQFRNIEALSFQPHHQLTLLTGPNGSGKSSVLEAIQCLSAGHTFRTRKPRELIRHHADALTLVARLKDHQTGSEHRCGVERQRDGSVALRLDFEPIGQLADITRLIPVKAITPDSFRLVLGGPEERRQFLDWGLFHGEPEFLNVWRQFRRALSQRNQLLREQRPQREIESWNEPLCEAADQLDAMRRRYVDALKAALSKRLADAAVTFHVELDYRRGWARERVLADLLQDNLEQHRRLKTTTDGPHRAELLLHDEQTPLKQCLSRGETKTLVYLLTLAQLDVLDSSDSRRAIVLCDDLSSELDELHADALVSQLLGLGGQVFVAGVDVPERLSQRASEHIQLAGGALQNKL